jgi:hypothetical protein
LTKKLTIAELNQEFPGWRDGRSGATPSIRSAAPGKSSNRRRTDDPVVKRLSAFLGILEKLLNEDLPIRIEYKFDPERKWKSDLAILPPHKILLEIEGGRWVPGGGFHQKGKRFSDDMEKYNAATAAGWKVLRVGWDHIMNGSALALIETTIERIGADGARD